MKTLIFVLTLLPCKPARADIPSSFNRVIRFFYLAAEACERGLTGNPSITSILSRAIYSSALRTSVFVARVRGKEEQFVAKYNWRTLYPLVPQSARWRRLRDRFDALNQPEVDIPADLLSSVRAYAVKNDLVLEILKSDMDLFTDSQLWLKRYAAKTLVLLDRRTMLVVARFAMPSSRKSPPTE